MTPESLLDGSGKPLGPQEGTLLGSLLESLVTLCVRVPAQAAETEVRHLHWLRRQIGDRLIDAVVINPGPGAYRRPDGIGVVPLGLLGP